MPFLKASCIHNGYRFLPQGSVLEITEDGRIVAVHERPIPLPHPVPEYEGIICPGFVNVHCHLELSHMAGIIEEGQGLVPFLQQVMLQRGNSGEAERQLAMKQALEAMKKQGIVAVGDIANTIDTLQCRMNGGLHFHTFVESIGFTEERAAERFARSLEVYESFAAQSLPDLILRQSIVPHAPYSVSPALFSLIDRHRPGSLISIHNEETPAENEYYRTKTGGMKELYKTLHIDDGFFRQSGKTSLQTYLPYLSEAHPLILVHNTYMDEEDIISLQQSSRKVHICLCPNANWYIERTMPPVPLFVRYDMDICLGTDSLSSNHQLSVLAEIRTIKKHFPDMEMETLLRWGTLNGARALQMDQTIGSFEAGKKPGIVCIGTDETVRVLY